MYLLKIDAQGNISGRAPLVVSMLMGGLMLYKLLMVDMLKSVLTQRMIKEY